MARGLVIQAPQLIDPFGGVPAQQTGKKSVNSNLLGQEEPLDLSDKEMFFAHRTGLRNEQEKLDYERMALKSEANRMYEENPKNIKEALLYYQNGLRKINEKQLELNDTAMNATQTYADFTTQMENMGKDGYVNADDYLLFKDPKTNELVANPNYMNTYSEQRAKVGKTGVLELDANGDPIYEEIKFQRPMTYGQYKQMVLEDPGILMPTVHNVNGKLTQVNPLVPSFSKTKNAFEDFLNKEVTQVKGMIDQYNQFKDGSSSITSENEEALFNFVNNSINNMPEAARDQLQREYIQQQHNFKKIITENKDGTKSFKDFTFKDYITQRYARKAGLLRMFEIGKVVTAEEAKALTTPKQAVTFTEALYRGELPVESNTIEDFKRIASSTGVQEQVDNMSALNAKYDSGNGKMTESEYKEQAGKINNKMAKLAAEALTVDLEDEYTFEPVDGLSVIEEGKKLLSGDIRFGAGEGYYYKDEDGKRFVIKDKNGNTISLDDYNAAKFKNADKLESIGSISKFGANIFNYSVPKKQKNNSNIYGNDISSPNFTHIGPGFIPYHHSGKVPVINIEYNYIKGNVPALGSDREQMELNGMKQARYVAKGMSVTTLEGVLEMQGDLWNPHTEKFEQIKYVENGKLTREAKELGAYRMKVSDAYTSSEDHISILNTYDHAKHGLANLFNYAKDNNEKWIYFVPDGVDYISEKSGIYGADRTVYLENISETFQKEESNSEDKEFLETHGR